MLMIGVPAINFNYQPRFDLEKKFCEQLSGQSSTPTISGCVAKINDY